MAQTGPEHPFGEPVEESPRKRTVVGKVKDKARKLRSKVKKPKSPGSAENNGSSSSSSGEEESGSDAQHQVGGPGGEERGLEATPGLKGESYEAVPDPHMNEKAPPTAGVEREFGQLDLKDKPAHAPPAPVDEGKGADGRDLLVTDPEETKPAKDKAIEGAAAAAAAGAAAVGVKSATDDDDSVEKKAADVPGEKKGLLAQAKERIFGSSKKIEGEPLPSGENKAPTATEKATTAATNLKDTVAAQFGYGEGGNPEDPANKPLTQKAQEGAANVKGQVASKLDSGDKPAEEKTYTERAYDAAIGAKDTVAEKIGYGAGATTTAEGDQKSYVQKAQESAIGAKDAVISKLGYSGGGDSVPASTADRFHPGEEDVALSQLITEKMSTGASTVRDTIMRPFGGRSDPPTPTTTPPPSSAQAVAADPLHTTVTGTEGENPGVVGKVTGAVSSLFGTSGSGKKIDEPASKAGEDLHPAPAPHVEETH